MKAEKEAEAKLNFRKRKLTEAIKHTKDSWKVSEQIRLVLCRNAMHSKTVTLKTFVSSCHKNDVLGDAFADIGTTVFLWCRGKASVLWWSLKSACGPS